MTTPTVPQIAAAVVSNALHLAAASITARSRAARPFPLSPRFGPVRRTPLAQPSFAAAEGPFPRHAPAAVMPLPLLFCLALLSLAFTLQKPHGCAGVLVDRTPALGCRWR